MIEYVKILAIVGSVGLFFIALFSFFIADALYDIKRELRKIRRVQQKSKADADEHR